MVVRIYVCIYLYLIVLSQLVVKGSSNIYILTFSYILERECCLRDECFLGVISRRRKIEDEDKVH